MTANFELWTSFSHAGKAYQYLDLGAAAAGDRYTVLKTLPFCLKVLLENNLRRAGGEEESRAILDRFADWQQSARDGANVNVYASRVLLQDYTGIPVLVDLCSLRQAAVDRGRDPATVNPRVPVDLVVDHSLVVDVSGNAQAEQLNSQNQHARNKARFTFLKWMAQAFDNLRVIPPDSGICHQVNLESLATGCTVDTAGGRLSVHPELVIGADSHTPTINSLGVLGWGVGGIEALSALLGDPLQMPMPEVVGLKLTGKLSPGVTATDCVLTVTAMLRRFGVVNKFVEFFGPGVSALAVPDRATIANMAPEYGATCSYFPWDGQTASYLDSTGRDSALLRAYATHAGLWHDAGDSAPVYSHVLELDLGSVRPVIAGPKRPEERRTLDEVPASFLTLQPEHEAAGQGEEGLIPHGAVLLAAITSCTNTANPALVVAAGLLARNAVQAGLSVPPWVKTSLAPGSLVVSRYLHDSGLQQYMDALGFQICGYGCTTCIGNSGSLLPMAMDAIDKQGLVGCGVLSGNRNFSGRVQQQLTNNYLASPPLVVAYALAGRITADLTREPIGRAKGKDVFLADIWPGQEEIQAIVDRHVDRDLFSLRRAALAQGSPQWDALKPAPTKVYEWADTSGYIAQPPFFAAGDASRPPAARIADARVLLLVGDGVTTDDISPAGRINANSDAGRYLASLGVNADGMHTFGARRGHWDVMLRGAFTNPNLVNEMAPEHKGGYTRMMPEGAVTPVLDAGRQYQKSGTPTVIVAGRNYGTGSSRDDAARSTRLLGVAAVIAESFERIHRSNLAAFGVMPLLFPEGVTRKTLRLDGSETFSIEIGRQPVLRGGTVACEIKRKDGGTERLELRSALRGDEVPYYTRGGILPWMADRV